MSRSLSPATRIGELDERVEFQREEFTAGDIGGQTRQWVAQFTAWAHVRALSGGERLSGDRVEATGNYRIAIRNRSDVDPLENWRCIWRGRALNIRFIENNGPRDLYVIMHAEIGAAT